MITKSDFQDVQEQMAAEDRQRLGDPPTVEELLAYSRGELPADEEDRVRELLVCYPDMARALTEPFPTEDDGSLSEEELSKRWASLKTRIHTPRDGQLVRFPHAWTALAAALALVFAGLFWQSESKARRLATELATPHAIGEGNVLFPEGQRGGGDGAVTVTADGGLYALEVPLINQRLYANYRLELVSDGRRLWISTPLRPRSDETFVVLVPRAFLKPGRYQVIAYGVGEGGKEERLGSYSMKLQ